MNQSYQGTRIIDGKTVEEFVKMNEAVEAAFRAHATGDEQRPPKSYVAVPRSVWTA